MNFQNVEFLISAAAPKDFPKNRLPEIPIGGFSFSATRPYFLTDERVCKESPRTFRMVLGLPRRPKRGSEPPLASSSVFCASPLRNPPWRNQTGADKICSGLFIHFLPFPHRDGSETYQGKHPQSAGKPCNSSSGPEIPQKRQYPPGQSL